MPHRPSQNCNTVVVKVVVVVKVRVVVSEVVSEVELFEDVGVVVVVGVVAHVLARPVQQSPSTIHPGSHRQMVDPFIKNPI